jgi:hypothetical protein
MTVTFHPSGRGKAQCPPDPDYPHGIAIDFAQGRASCTATLPYPAPECGYFLVACELCDLRMAVTAAGRPDDPTSVKVACKFDPSHDH